MIIMYPLPLRFAWFQVDNNEEAKEKEERNLIPSQLFGKETSQLVNRKNKCKRKIIYQQYGRVCLSTKMTVYVKCLKSEVK